MATPKQFAIQQVLNLLLRRPADKSIIAYLDNLKTSGLENTMEMTYPQGGCGNVYIGVGFAHSKRAKLNVETATWNTNVMAIQNGIEVATGDTEVIEYDVISYVTGEGYKTKFRALGAPNEEIGFVYLLNEDGTQGKVYTQTETIGMTGDNFQYSLEPQNLNFSLQESDALRASNAKLCCAYKRMTTGDKAQKISLTGTSIPSVVLVTGYGVVMDICSNIAYLCQFNGKAQVDGNYTFDLSADGDPSVQSLNLEFVRDCGVEELYSFVIYDDDEHRNNESNFTPSITPPPITDFYFDVNDGIVAEHQPKDAVKSLVIQNLRFPVGFEIGQTWRWSFLFPNADTGELEERGSFTIDVGEITMNGYTGLGIQISEREGILDKTEVNRATPNDNTSAAVFTANADTTACVVCGLDTNGDVIPSVCHLVLVTN
jgi:hypothetical protein